MRRKSQICEQGKFLVRSTAQLCRETNYNQHFYFKEWQFDKNTTVGIEMHLKVSTKPTNKSITKVAEVTIWDAYAIPIKGNHEAKNFDKEAIAELLKLQIESLLNK